MAAPGTSRIETWRWVAVGLLIATLRLSAAEPIRLSLQQVNERKSPKFEPVHLGQRVQVQGVVNSHAYRFSDFDLVAMDDGEYGAILRIAPDNAGIPSLRPGDEIRVIGTVSLRDGMPLLDPEKVERIATKPVPQPKLVRAEQLAGFRYLGRLVRTEGTVSGFGNSVHGAYLKLDLPLRLTVFLPGPASSQDLIANTRVGERVQVTGVGHQFSDAPPYNGDFEILVNDVNSVVPADPSWRVQPSVVVAAAGGVLLAIFLLWHREKRLQNQREKQRKTYQLGEEILSATSIEMILKRLDEALPVILGVTKVHLFVYNRAAKALDAVGNGTDEGTTISLSSPPGGPSSGAVACFHYRTLLMIGDVEKSPFPIAKSNAKVPKSLMFVPMMGQGEVVGVLELDQFNRVREFTSDEQELAQHLANQVAVAVRLLDQRTVQEQLFRTEKMAAVGRLISGVVNELQAPLESIANLAGRAAERARSGPSERDVLAIGDEAEKAISIVSRLVSFASAEQVEARQVSVGDVLRNLIEFREGDWKASGIRVRDLITPEPLWVVGSQGQLEQVFLNLLVHAEQSLKESPQKLITVRTSVLAKRLLVEIAFSAPPETRKTEETASVLGVTRSVVAAHGGEVRLIEKPQSEPKFEVELPAVARERSTTTVAAPVNGGSTAKVGLTRSLTALVIDPDEAPQRQIVGMLSSRGCRVVPVNNSDSGLDLAQRMRFDVVFCSVHAPGLNWVELSERLQSRVGGFVLVSDGHNPELASDFEGDNRFVMPRPYQEAELDRVLGEVEHTLPAIRHGAA